MANKTISRDNAFQNLIQIAENTDLNDLTVPGVYLSPSAAISATLTNCPTISGNFQMIVMSIGTTNTTQFIFGTESIYLRRKWASGWDTTWKRLPSDNYFLVYRGSFYGDINDTTISAGIYSINAANSYTHTDLDTAQITVPSYCPMVIFPYFCTQLFITNPLIIRKYIGNPAKWNTFSYDRDKYYGGS